MWAMGLKAVQGMNREVTHRVISSCLDHPKNTVYGTKYKNPEMSG
jgi:hypothetical protein